MDITHTTFTVILSAALIVCGCSLALATSANSSGPVVVEMNDGQGSKIACWLETSLKRIYPTSPVGNRDKLSLLTARNARISFQACFRNQSTRGLTVECSVDAPEGLDVSVRRVGYVPMWNHTAGVPMDEQDGVGYTPGLVPDPLFPERMVVSGPQGNQSFWITVSVSKDIDPGVKQLIVHLKPVGAKDEAKLTVDLEVSPFIVKPRRNFPVTHWWNADGIFDYYKTGRFDDRWFEIAENYLKNMVSHGSNVIFVPLFHHRMEVVLRPAQLLIVTEPEPGKYKFDWRKTRRFVQMARKCGFDYFEWPHFWHMKITPEGVITSADETQRIYAQKGDKLELILPRDYPATGEKYVSFLKQFLPEFHRFLVDEKLLDISYFHVSDEPGGREEDIAKYKKVRDLLVELAPWMKGKLLDAMSDVRYGTMNLMDFPVPNVAAAADYMARKIPHWVYYCCGPKGPYLNRFFDTPLPKIRMSGWLFYKHKALGFLHWGYNYWYVMDLGHNPVPQNMIDPFTDGAVGTTAGGEGEPYGDSFVVYPGSDGKPIDSIRWEVFAESLQDYAILQTAGIKPDDPMFSELIDYGAFPKSEQWIDNALRRVLTRIEGG